METFLWIIGGLIALVVFFALLPYLIQIAICAIGGAILFGGIADFGFGCFRLWGMNVFLIGCIIGGVIGIILSIHDIIVGEKTITIEFWE